VVAVVDAKAHGRMDFEVIQRVPAQPLNATGLIAGRRLSRDVTAAETDRKLLPNLAIVVGDNVIGVAVDPDEPSHLDLDAGLLERFANRGPFNVFPDLLAAAGQRPQPVVGSLDQQGLLLVVEDEDRYGHDDTVGLWRGRISKVVSATHGPRVPRRPARRVARPTGPCQSCRRKCRTALHRRVAEDGVRVREAPETRIRVC